MEENQQWDFFFSKRKEERPFSPIPHSEPLPVFVYVCWRPLLANLTSWAALRDRREGSLTNVSVFAFFKQTQVKRGSIHTRPRQLVTSGWREMKPQNVSVLMTPLPALLIRMWLLIDFEESSEALSYLQPSFSHRVCSSVSGHMASDSHLTSTSSFSGGESLWAHECHIPKQYFQEAVTC